MNKNKRRFFWISHGIVICAYFVLVFVGVLDFKSTYYMLIYLLLVAVGFGLDGFFLKRKIERMKTDLGVVEDLSLEALESLRVERDYQENFVKKLDLDKSR